MRRASVDLPQPDSPTSARVSPGATSKLTSSTARSRRRGSPSSTRLSQGRETSKSRLTRFKLRSALRSGMQPAGGLARPRGKQAGTLDEAALEAPRTARIERAAWRDGIQPRHRAVDLRKTLALGRNARDGA